MLMRTKSCLVLVALVVGLCLSAHAATYSGNGNSGFGGPIGQGSLSLTDDGTTVSGTVTRGAGPYNDILVLYVDSGPGGFANIGRGLGCAKPSPFSTWRNTSA